MYLHDDIVDPQTLRIDLARYRPVGRLFGSLHCRMRDVVSCPTVSYEAWAAAKGPRNGR